MDWKDAVEAINPYLFRIHTPNGHGTGFLCLYNEDKFLCGVATALHVVDDADEWQQPIRLVHHHSGKIIFLKENERIVFPDPSTDSAIILFPTPDFELPKEVVNLRPLTKPLEIGKEVGWLGFPRIEPNTLCFFSGNISAVQPTKYLIDGVAIHGVSGGPVFCAENVKGVQIVGIVSEYHANRMHGDSLPGLLYAQDVTHFHKAVERVKSLDEGKRKREEEKQTAEISNATGATSPNK